MRTVIALAMIFLLFIIFLSSILKNVDLTPDTAAVVEAAAILSSEPPVVTVPESPAVIIPVTAMVPVTGGCATAYIVEPGDWLLKIARNCDTTLAVILQANPQIIDRDLIYPEQQISLPGGSAISSVPVTGPRSGIRAGDVLQVQVINFPPNSAVNVAIGPETSGYTVVTSGMTDNSGNLTTHITVPSAADAQTPWLVAVASISDAPIQAVSESFFIQ
jgi:LysM repeat protein